MKRNDYELSFLNLASSLDTMTNSRGLITQCAMNIVHQKDENSVVQLCSIMSKIAEIGNLENISKTKELKDALIKLCGYRQLLSICTPDSNGMEVEKSLDELLVELNNLVGLECVKSKVNDLIAFQKVQLIRKKYGLTLHKNTLHLAFTGNPGTGKTTVARIVGRIYKQIGLLSKGHFTEVSRTDLIAGYQGQTALKVKGVIERTKGGVLFIDEAYSITENEHSDSYGRECLTELTKALEDYRDDLVVIVAGYTEPMKQFFESNPGLKSRFNTFIEFEDYNSEELMKIMEVMCLKNDYLLTEALKSTLQVDFLEIVKNKEVNFSNGRYIRNFFEEMMFNHARRISQLNTPSIEDVQTFTELDIPRNL